MVGTPVKREGVEDLLWAMTMLPEFQLIYYPRMNLAQPCRNRNSADFQVCCVGVSKPAARRLSHAPPIWKSAIRQGLKTALHGMGEVVGYENGPTWFYEEGPRGPAVRAGRRV